MTDRLTLTRALESSGMQGNAAERIATEIYDAIHDNVATKADVRELKGDLKADLHELKGELKANVQELKGEMRELELRLETKIDRTFSRLGALVVILSGLLFAALHYWPSHG